MSCRYCGTLLPDEALFCPECGRAVTFDQTRMPSTASGPAAGSIAPAPTATLLADSAPTGVDPAADDEAEDDWDEELPAAASTGFSIADLALEPPVEEAPVEEAPGQETPADEPPANAQYDSLATSIIVLPHLISLGEPALPSPAVSAEPAVAETSIDELVHESPAAIAAAEAAARAAAGTVDPDLDFDESSPFSLPPIAQIPPQSPRARPTPDPFPWGTERALTEDIEATRLTADTASGTRFVLQFSTGESVTVMGSGLVGRNPSMQPGEFVDQLVPIFDAGKSVSKTHLEYGQDGGRFWISDRYSTNGSTIRQPDTEPRRADPGRRYFVARGTRVDVGEQFFVVS